jgi:hypothetical protein
VGRRSLTDREAIGGTIVPGQPPAAGLVDPSRPPREVLFARISARRSRRSRPVKLCALIRAHRSKPGSGAAPGVGAYALSNDHCPRPWRSAPGRRVPLCQRTLRHVYHPRSVREGKESGWGGRRRTDVLRDDEAACRGSRLRTKLAPSEAVIEVQGRYTPSWRRSPRALLPRNRDRHLRPGRRRVDPDARNESEPARAPTTTGHAPRCCTDHRCPAHLAPLHC